MPLSNQETFFFSCFLNHFKNGKAILRSHGRRGSSSVWPILLFYGTWRGIPTSPKNPTHSHCSVLKMKEPTPDIGNLVWLALQELILPIPEFLECSVSVGLDKIVGQIGSNLALAFFPFHAMILWHRWLQKKASNELDFFGTSWLKNKIGRRKAKSLRFSTA